VLDMLDDGVTQLGVATDHVIESFRNDLCPGYISSEGIEPEILEQFEPLEDALRAMGVVVFPMTDLEADDGLASAAAIASGDKRVEQVLICSPDKDMAQCVVGRHIVQFDRRKREMRDEDGVVEKFGIPPPSIPDYLALVGDSSDGFPGLKGWGPKSASTVLAKFNRLGDIPDSARQWGLSVRGADGLARTLRENRELAELFCDLATLRRDAPLFTDVEEVRWHGPAETFKSLSERLGTPALASRASDLAKGR
jgi:5'-3' exonuclease